MCFITLTAKKLSSFADQRKQAVRVDSGYHRTWQVETDNNCIASEFLSSKEFFVGRLLQSSTVTPSININKFNVQFFCEFRFHFKFQIHFKKFAIHKMKSWLLCAVLATLIFQLVLVDAKSKFNFKTLLTLFR